MNNSYIKWKIKWVIKNRIPVKIFYKIQQWRQFLIFIFFSVLRKGSNFFCPVCKFSFKKTYDKHAKFCPKCGSAERQRLTWLYLEKNILKNDKISFLHIAPERKFKENLKKNENLQYSNIDLYSPVADTKMDITNLTYSNNTFDLVLCSHVLEHIPEDKKAMSEIFRVLKSQGIAIILVPIFGNETKEDLTMTDPYFRRVNYHQEDHVRLYGMDVQERLKSVGFHVEYINYIESFSQDDIKRFAISMSHFPGDIILKCTK